MMRIAVIEFSYHAELLNSLGELFFNGDIVVDFYVTPKVYKALSDRVKTNFTCFIIPEEVPLASHLLQLRPSLDTYQLVFFNTVSDQFAAVEKLTLNVPTLLRIHNVHSTFAPFSHIHIKLNFYFLWKAASYLVRRQVLHLDWYFQFRFLKKVNAYSFLTEAIEEYARKWVPEAKIGPRLPSEICKIDLDQLDQPEPGSVFNLVVPGEINRRKRDYELLYRALKQCRIEPKRQVNITLLGQPRDNYGKSMAKLFQELATEQMTVKTYDGRVEEIEFERVMHEAHLIAAPVIIKTSFAIYWEQYGYTKISGAQSDAIRYCKPLLIPASLRFDEALAPLIWTFKNEKDLTHQLENLINTSTLAKNRPAQIEALRRYKPENLLPNVSKALRQFIEAHQKS